METTGDDSEASSSLLPQAAKVVVVGAGIAGVTAAASLIHNGLTDVLVLEAQDYVGGRVKGTLVDGKMLDFGPMFIHGQEGNPLFDIVKTVGSVIEDGHEDDILNRPEYFLASSGEKVPFTDVEELIDCLEDSQDDLELGPDQEESRSLADLMSSFYQKFLDSRRASLGSRRKELFDAAYQWYCFYEKINEGTDDLGKVSAWAGQAYHEFKGNHFTRVVGGYSVIMQALVDLLPGGLVHTGTPVSRIQWADTDQGNVLVECQNGDSIVADHVIITISLGCLKAVHSSMFQPALPSPFLQTVEKIELGAPGKIFLQWTTPFWDTNTLSYEFLWLQSKPVVLKTDKSNRQTKKKKLWWEDIPGVETISSHVNILLIWLLPHQVEALVDVDDEEVKAVLHELLQTFFCDVIVPEPVAVYRSDWLENPYVRGAYCYPTPSLKRSDKKHLGEAMPSSKNPRLLFAGEGYSLEYMTTTHGAFLTAEHQASKVLHANGITDSVRSLVEVVASKH